jgi:xanthine dehydrogenase YagT iron-sulfur-binding subunit
MGRDRDLTNGRGKGVTRRGFLGSVGAGAMAAATGLPRPVGAVPVIDEPKGVVETALSINGRTYRLLVEPRWTLLFVLRERLGITGTKIGCARGECGSCTVLVDGLPRYACMTLVLEAEGREITTVEGLMQGEELGDVQQAFVEEDAFQCGYCTAGQIVTAEGLLTANPSPTVDEIRAGMAGNLCRCGAYVHIFRAVDRVARARRKGDDR